MHFYCLCTCVRYTSAYLPPLQIYPSSRSQGDAAHWFRSKRTHLSLFEFGSWFRQGWKFVLALPSTHTNLLRHWVISVFVKSISTLQAVSSPNCSSLNKPIHRLPIGWSSSMPSLNVRKWINWHRNTCVWHSNEKPYVRRKNSQRIKNILCGNWC